MIPSVAVPREPAALPIETEESMTAAEVCGTASSQSNEDENVAAAFTLTPVSDDTPDRLLLQALPKFYAGLRLAGSVLAVVLRHIDDRKLYRLVGCESTAAWAREHLKIENKNTLYGWLQAGTAAWRLFPEECEQITERLQGTRLERSNLGDLPALPDNSKMVLGGRLLNAIETSQPARHRNQKRRELAQRLLNDDCTVEELRDKLKNVSSRESLKGKRAKKDSAVEVAATSGDALSTGKAENTQLKATGNTGPNAYTEHVPSDIAELLPSLNALEKVLLGYRPGALDQQALQTVQDRVDRLDEELHRLRFTRNSERGAEAGA